MNNLDTFEAEKQECGITYVGIKYHVIGIGTARMITGKEFRKRTNTFTTLIRLYIFQ